MVCIASLLIEQTGFAQVAGQLGVPAYLQNLEPVADQFRPVHLRSISPDQSLTKLDLLLDKGDSKQLTNEQVQDTAGKLMEYFRIGLQLPNSMFWVNLRPDAPDNIIDPYLEKTDIGKIFLEADLQLKKDLARFTNPDTKEGKDYWDKLYQRAENLFGNNDLEIPTVTRPWIVPGEIVVGETANTAYVYKATLKVMLEQDYLTDASAYVSSDPRLKELNAYSSELIRTAIIPKLTREVNASKRYAALRQVYYSLILAQWFKTKFKTGSGIDQKDLTGVMSTSAWSKDKYYSAYKRSLSEGEYKKEQAVQTSSGLTIRTYVSGGIAAMMSGQIATVNAIPSVDSTIKVSVDIDGGSFTIATGIYSPEPGDPEKTIRTYQSMYEHLYNMELPRDQMRVSEPQDVPLRDLIRSQPAITAVELAERLSAEQREKKPPIVVWKDEGGLYIVDGHHRAAAAALRNEENIQAYIIEPPQRAKGLLAMTKIWPDQLSETEIGSINIKYEDSLKRSRSVRLDQIRGYTVNKDSVTFLFSTKQDGGKNDDADVLTQAERLIDLLWQNFVFTKQGSVFKDLTDAEVQWMRSGPVDPNYLAQFRKHIQETFLKEQGSYNTVTLKQLIEKKDLGMHIVYRVLKPLFYSSVEQHRILEIIREFPYFGGAVLTVEMIEKQLRKEHLAADAYSAVDITALARLRAISIKKDKTGFWAVTGLLKNSETGEYNFEQFFSEFKPGEKAKDSLKGALMDFFIETMRIREIRADDRSRIREVLRDISYGDINKRLNRTVSRNAFGSSKNQIVKLLRDLPVDKIQQLLDEGSGVLYKNNRPTAGNGAKDGGMNGSLRQQYEFPDQPLSVAADGTVSMQNAGKRYVVTPEGQWFVMMNVAQTLMRNMKYDETNKMIAAMKQYAEADKADDPGAERVKAVLEESVDQLMTFLLPSEPPVKEATADSTQAEAPESAPQNNKRPALKEPRTAAHRPFYKLWQAYSRRVKNGEYAEALEMTGKNIDEFKKYIRPQISSREKKANFVNNLSSKKNGADVYSGLVYMFLNLFWTPDIKHKQMIATIYNHEYQKGPLSIASLSSAAKISPAQLWQYIRILEGTGAIELGSYESDTKREKRAIKSKDNEILAGWFGEYLDIDETGAKIKDGGVDQKVAGIDLRTLASTGALTTPASRRTEQVKAVSPEVLQSQWTEISKDIQAGNMPYERVADYVIQCQAQDAKEELAAVVDYIAVILRMEEPYSISTPQQMKDILANMR